MAAMRDELSQHILGTTFNMEEGRVLEKLDGS